MILTVLTVARSHEFADLSADDPHPTKDNRQLPAATLQSLIAAVYM
jgi:hypothetical protein